MKKSKEGVSEEELIKKVDEAIGCKYKDLVEQTRVTEDKFYLIKLS